jgi:hypothetical protein
VTPMCSAGRARARVEVDGGGRKTNYERLPFLIRWRLLARTESSAAAHGRRAVQFCWTSKATGKKTEPDRARIRLAPSHVERRGKTASMEKHQAGGSRKCGWLCPHRTSRKRRGLHMRGGSLETDGKKRIELCIRGRTPCDAQVRIFHPVRKSRGERKKQRFR